MRRHGLTLAVTGCVLMLASTAGAVSITLGGVAAIGGGLTTARNDAVVYDFSDGKPAPYAAGAAQEGAVVTGSVGGAYAAPAGDTTAYLTVAYGRAVGSQDIVLGADQIYFGLYWGSIDTYNTISFYDDGQLVGSWGGGQIVNEANGDQVASGTNVYVNFSDLLFDRITLSSANFAFESDNHAFVAAPVPEPASLVLLGSGLLGLARYARRRVTR